MSDSNDQTKGETMRKATVDIFGDELSVTWTGNVWQTTVGAQYASRTDAMRDELVDYFRSCGEDTDDPRIQEEIEGYLDLIK